MGIRAKTARKGMGAGPSVVAIHAQRDKSGWERWIWRNLYAQRASGDKSGSRLLGCRVLHVPRDPSALLLSKAVVYTGEPVPAHGPSPHGDEASA